MAYRELVAAYVSGRHMSCILLAGSVVERHLTLMHRVHGGRWRGDVFEEKSEADMRGRLDTPIGFSCGRSCSRDRRPRCGRLRADIVALIFPPSDAGEGRVGSARALGAGGEERPLPGRDLRDDALARPSLPGWRKEHTERRNSFSSPSPPQDRAGTAPAEACACPGGVHPHASALQCRWARPATVKAMYPDQGEGARRRLVLGNTYHLMLRPTAERIASSAACTAS